MSSNITECYKADSYGIVSVKIQCLNCEQRPRDDVSVNVSKGELVSVTVVKLSGAAREFVCFGNGNGIVNRIGYQFLVPTEVLSISLSRRLSQPQINSQTESNEIIFISLGPDSRYKHPSLPTPACPELS